MNKSESIKNIGAALAVFHDKVGTIKKDAKNPFFKSTYASLSNILEQIQEPLKASGLIYTQFPGEGLTTILMHPESGEWIESEYKITPVKNDPQSVGSAITYARRYALSAVLGLNIDPDDDGSAGSGKINGTVVKQPEPKTLPELVVGTEEYDKTAKALAAGKATLADVKKKRTVSTLTETQLVRDAKLITNNN